MNNKNNRTKGVVKNWSEFITEGLSQRDLNEILDKIGTNGIESLTPLEVKLLNSFSDANIDIKKEIEIQSNKFKTAKDVLNKIPLGVSDDELEKNIGRTIRFKQIDKKKQGMLTYMGSLHEIIAIQKHWGHNEHGKYVPDMVGYRVALIGYDNDFGRVAAISEIDFVNISEEDAIKINKEIMDML